MDGRSPTAHWRERVIDRILFGSEWAGTDSRPLEPGSPRQVPHTRPTGREVPGGQGRSLFGGPVLLVRALIAAGVLVPGWALVIGAVAPLPAWVVLVGAAVATVPAFLAAVLAADLQCALVREVYNLRTGHPRCGHCAENGTARLRPAHRQSGAAR